MYTVHSDINACINYIIYFTVNMCLSIQVHVHLHSPLSCWLECFVSGTSTNRLSARLVLAPVNAEGVLQVHMYIVHVHMYMSRRNINRS